METTNLIKEKEKYSRLKTEIFYLLEQDAEYSNKVRKLLAETEQDCQARGIKSDDFLFLHEKAAAMLYAFKHKFSPNEGRGKYVQGLLISNGYSWESMETIKGLIKQREEGMLEKIVVGTDK